MGFDVGGITITSPAGATLSMDSGATNWMKVDANGILTRPQTPFMRGQISGRGSAYNAGGGALLVVSDVNVGNCWNNATGLWTCPVAGYYMVCMFAISGGMVSSGYIHVQKNGTTVRYTHWNHNASWHNVTLSAVILCAAGDTIRWVVVSQSPAGAGVHGNGNHAMYSIALMA